MLKFHIHSYPNNTCMCLYVLISHEGLAPGPTVYLKMLLFEKIEKKKVRR